MKKEFKRIVKDQVAKAVALYYRDFKKDISNLEIEVKLLKSELERQRQPILRIIGFDPLSKDNLIKEILVKNSHMEE